MPTACNCARWRISAIPASGCARSAGTTESACWGTPWGTSVRLASVELDRAVEGAIGLVLLTVALAWTAFVLLRRWRARRAARTEDPGVPALARFAGIETSDPDTFGGGAPAARVGRREDTVTYGYLAVA